MPLDVSDADILEVFDDVIDISLYLVKDLGCGVYRDVLLIAVFLDLIDVLELLEDLLEAFDDYIIEDIVP